MSGIFPASFVEIMVDLPSAPVASATSQTLGFVIPIIGVALCFSVASVLFDFEGRYPDELSVFAGDSVNVLDFPSNDWARCWNPITEKSGIVPISFLQIFFDEDEPDYGTQTDNASQINNEPMDFPSSRNSIASEVIDSCG